MIEVREIKGEEVQKAVDTLVQAFFDDPLVCYIFPESNFRRMFISWVYERWIRLLMKFNTVFVDEEVRGVAVCVPPRLFPHIPLQYQIKAGLLGVIPRLGIRNFWKPFRVYLDSQKRTRSEVTKPSWILDILGVQPEYQGKGVGSALVQHLINCAKHDNVPVYVITHKEQNIKFYEKNGFNLIKKEFSLPGGPPTCSLICYP